MPPGEYERVAKVVAGSDVCSKGVMFVAGSDVCSRE